MAYIHFKIRMLYLWHIACEYKIRFKSKIEGGEKMKRFLVVMAIVLCAVCVVRVHAVQATAMLELSSNNGLSWTTITDGGAGDANSAAGAITFVGSIGNWNINVTTGLTKPAIGSATLPAMDLNSVDMSTGKGTLLIRFIDYGFGPSTGSLISSVGGTTPGTVSFETLLNGSPINSFGSFSSPAFSASSTVGASLASNSTIEMDASITQGKSGTSSFDYANNVPEPGMLLMLGTGLVGLAFFRIRRRT